jgi:glycosyltransferase involved in cell wall biosynthesis
VPSGADAPLRVAFHDVVNAGWTAGAHYYKNLFIALRQLDDSTRPRIVVLVPPVVPPGGYETYRDLADEVVELPRAGVVDHYVRRTTRRLGLGPRSSRRLDRMLTDEGIDSMFVSWAEFDTPVAVPLLGWIHDFQHRHLPELFLPKELAHRDDLFERLAAGSTRVVLSSEDARKDFEHFLPSHAKKARVLRFVAQVSPDVYDTDPGWICDEYHLPRRYVYLPNQFWVHKGHRLVIEALAQLRVSRPDVTVVCTGNTADHRKPTYFGELLAEVSRLGVRDTFVILGWVPQTHIPYLMRQAVAVLQPSRFEGWSTTVEETKSVGKSIILSDIPVHREQAPAGVHYFDPTDAAALADQLVAAYDTCSPGPDEALEQAAREALPKRTREYAETFVDIASGATTAPTVDVDRSSGA